MYEGRVDILLFLRARAPKRGPPVGGAAHRLERRVKELDKVDETIRMNKTKGTHISRVIYILT